MKGNIPIEMQIKWDEPEVNPDTGAWTVHVQNLRRRTSQNLFRHEMCSYITSDEQQAHVTFAKAYIAAWGAPQCWWFLREEICERMVFLPAHIDQQLEAVLERPWMEDDRDDWDGGDGAWGRLDYIS